MYDPSTGRTEFKKLGIVKGCLRCASVANYCIDKEDRLHILEIDSPFKKGIWYYCFNLITGVCKEKNYIDYEASPEIWYGLFYPWIDVDEDGQIYGGFVEEGRNKIILLKKEISEEYNLEIEFAYVKELPPPPALPSKDNGMNLLEIEFIDAEQYLPTENDTPSVRVRLVDAEGNTITGEEKIVIFKLTGTTGKDLPFEFSWEDGTVSTREVILSSKTGCTDWLKLKSYSYYGVVGVEVQIKGEEISSRKELPVDLDDDTMADCWERQYLTALGLNSIEDLKPEDDNETIPGIIEIGDGLKVINEYRGVYSKTAGIFERFNPAMKDMLAEWELTRPSEFENYLQAIGINIIHIWDNIIFCGDQTKPTTYFTVRSCLSFPGNNGIFLDEIDSLISKRGYGDKDISRKILAQLLIELDKIRDVRGVIVIGATNRPMDLDPALLRPGRLGKLCLLYTSPSPRD